MNQKSMNGFRIESADRGDSEVAAKPLTAKARITAHPGR